MQSIIDDLVEHWPIYLSMPLIAALIGYVTKRVAIEMMFLPLEFKGIKGTFIGWQGVIPRNSERMASIAVDLLTDLINPKEIFAKLDPERITEELREPMRRAVEDATRDLMAEYQPQLWELLPDRAQRLLIDQLQSAAPKVAERLLREIAENIEDVLDVKDMTIRNLVRNKTLLNRLIRDVANPEMRFIARSGIYFGFIIGLIQVVAWALTHSPWVLPIFGGLTGWLTDWLALKMIFFPREPKRFFGLFTWQGMFQRRRHEVTHDYGDLIAREVLTVENVLEAVLTGPKSDRLITLIQREVQATIDAKISLIKPAVVLAVGPRRYQEMKQAAAQRAIDLIPATVRHAEQYASDALDVRNMIITQMSTLTPLQYEGLLRPAFRQDEWKLIAVGTVIGFLVGELQVLLLLH